MCVSEGFFFFFSRSRSEIDRRTLKPFLMGWWVGAGNELVGDSFFFFSSDLVNFKILMISLMLNVNVEMYFNG